jgi:cobalt-zinc-cadmium efflux system membrane fusion protein
MKVLAIVTALFVVTGCGRREGPLREDTPAPSAASAPNEHEDGRHEALPRRVKVSKQVVENAGIAVSRVEKAALSGALTLPGEIAADPDRVARIASPAAGRIAEVRFREGQVIKKGEALLVIRVPEIARVRASQLATRAKAKAARANAARLRTLLAERLASEQAVLDAEAEADALELEAKSGADELGALGASASGAFAITLRAPIGGTVVARDAVVGQPVSAEQALGTLADLDQVWFLARVFEKDLGQLALGAKAEVHLNAYPDEHFAGSVEYIGQQIDVVARTVTARVRLRNRDGLLRLGLFGTSQISIAAPGKSEPKLVVDRASVTDIAGKDVVFVREREGEYELHEITLGREALGKVEVLAGLREGEEVVRDGVFTLKSLVLKGSFAEDE